MMKWTQLISKFALISAMLTGCSNQCKTESRWYARYPDNTPARLVAKEKRGKTAIWYYFDLDGNPNTAEVGFPITGRCKSCTAKMESLPMDGYVTVGQLYALSKMMGSCSSFWRYGISDGMHIGLNSTQKSFSKNVSLLRGGR